MIHLGYLAYDFRKREWSIPNAEVASVFAAAVRTSGWKTVAEALENSEKLLWAIWGKNEGAQM